ncbi:hypothetical protein B0T26DRAFT_791692 [Lasiosphaeria miniovina]|uniref:Uncharacterized protein n=1 Tax=Lasiosphaeria miniovina TaxID=1954250 RepID=A0AA39ZT07_9PEZI|nr:uncharacterized protein B0T26DRAFT_791692 [Lasiosphaeria miniovina]KAK0703076.1 hypothetical protein B0T26DRAFT_791692 [Lasiosphaeria miniovina]
MTSPTNGRRFYSFTDVPNTSNLRFLPQIFASTNELFAYLKACEHAKASKILDSMDLPGTDETLMEALPELGRRSQTAEDFEFWFDPGASRSVILRFFLNTLEHSIEKREGRRLRGVGRGPKLSEWATFKVHMPGTDLQGKPVMMMFTKSAWVVGIDIPNILTANDFLRPHEVNIDYHSEQIFFKKLDLKVPFVYNNRSQPCVRKVSTQSTQHLSTP